MIKICRDLERKSVERDLILVRLIEISLDLDKKFVECEDYFASWILHHLAFHMRGRRKKGKGKEKVLKHANNSAAFYNFARQIALIQYPGQSI